MAARTSPEARRDGGDHLAESVVHIATATDEAYLPYVAAMAWSLAARRHPDTELELTILYAGVSAADRARVETGTDGITVRWVSMHADNYRRWGVEPEPFILDPHYFRCLLARIYPETVKRAVYIDSDTIVLKDLRSLWSWPLGGNPIAAVGDLVSVIGDAISHWQEIGLDRDAPYFNASVMVIDLARWRTENIGERVLRQCQENRHRLLIQNRWNQHDQYGLNVVLQHRWTALPPCWNHYAERALDDTGIVHFLGDMKPGAPLALPECTELFIQAVDATPWAGWRPPGATTT